MSDPTSPTLTTPLPVSAATSPDTAPEAPVGAVDLFEDAPGSSKTAPAHVHFDLGDVYRANGDPEAWAVAFAGQIGAITGVWFSPDSLAEVFELHAAQISREEARDVAFQIANLAIPARIDGDGASQLLKLRTDITGGLLRRAGL